MIPRVAWRDTASVWPSLRLQLQLAPWHWAWRPKWYADTDGVGFLFTFELLMLEVQLAGNDVLFPIEWSNAPRCRVCGCTDLRACWPTCFWVEPDLCSRPPR